jgi:hypothetical protein
MSEINNLTFILQFSIKVSESLSVEEIHDLVFRENIILSYTGEITNEMVDAVLTSFKKEDNGMGFTTKSKIYRVMVECLENVVRHSKVKETQGRPSLFMLLNQGRSYEIVTGNFIYRKESELLGELIGELNTMTKDQIKEKYRHVISNGTITDDQQGAGLGIIDIAIKTGGKLDYQFVPVQDDIYFYVLKATVN